MFKIKMLCYDGECLPYDDEPAYNPLHENAEKAIRKAKQLAKDECLSLNDSADNQFRIVVEPNCVRVVSGYGKETTDITTYYLEEVPEVLLYGVTKTSVEKDAKVPEIQMESTVYTSKEEAQAAAWQAYSREFALADDYGLLYETSKKIRQSAFFKNLWSGSVIQNRKDAQVKFTGWTQPLKLEG